MGYKGKFMCTVHTAVSKKANLGKKRRQEMNPKAISIPESCLAEGIS